MICYFSKFEISIQFPSPPILLQKDIFSHFAGGIRMKKYQIIYLYSDLTGFATNVQNYASRVQLVFYLYV